MLNSLMVSLFIFISIIIPKYKSVDIELFYGIVLILIIFIIKKKNITDIKFLFSLIISIVLLIILSGITAILMSEYYAFLAALRVLLFLMINFLIINLVSTSVIWKSAYISIIFAVIIIYSEYLNIFGMREWIREINNIFYENRSVDYRAKGLFPGYASASVFFGIATVFLYIGVQFRELKHKSVHLVIVLCLIATIFTGRTGMLLALCGFFLIFIINYRTILKKITLNNLIKISLIFLIGFGALQLIKSVNEEVFYITQIRAFEFFYNYQDGGGLSTNSTDELFNTYTLPDEPRVILIGNNKAPWGSDGIESDSGYIQAAYQYGLLGFVLYYFPLIVILYFILRTRDIKYFYATILLFLFFLSDLKGSYIYSKSIFIMFLIVYLTIRKDNTNVSKKLTKELDYETSS